MPRLVRATLLSMRDLAATLGPFALLALALLAGAYFLLDPAPPGRVVLATGPEQSAYAEFGRRYVEELKRAGVEVALRPSAGSRENLRWLRDPGERVDLAFVQGGASERTRTAEEEEKKDEERPVVSLGSLFYEPVWIFYRAEAAQAAGKDATLGRLAQLRGWKVAVGGRGSGTPGLVTRLLQANLLERDSVKRAYLDPTPAAEALLSGEVDAAVYVSAPESPLVQTLLQTPFLRLYEFPQAEAYARRYKFLSPVALPRGVVDIARDVPPLYEFRVRSRIFRWYRLLREIEARLGLPDADREALLAELARLDAKAERITVPLSHADELYDLRAHIALVQKRVSGA
jgi:TRAP-type uncharacterized transport system substrate-binding protein